jgi:hypothetical protein
MDVHDAATGEGREMARVTVWDPPRRIAFTDARRTDTEVAQAAQRRKERAAKRQSAAPAQAALPPPNDQLLLPPATETQVRSRVSARKLR